MKNYRLIILIVGVVIASAALSFNPARAYSLHAIVSKYTHTYDLNCGNKKCLVTVRLVQNSEMLLPTLFTWQYRVNNPKGAFSNPQKSNEQFQFVLERKNRTHFLIEVRTLLLNKVIAESQHSVAINDFGL